MRPPPHTDEDWCDCCGWHLPRPIKDTYWYKYVWCRNCVEHYKEFLINRGFNYRGLHHSWLYLAYEDYEIEILKSVVQDYHIPLVLYWQSRDALEEVRKQQEEIRQIVLMPEPSRLEKFKQFIFNLVVAWCQRH